MGYDFTGIYNIMDDKVSLFNGDEIKVLNKKEVLPRYETLIGRIRILVDGVYPPFSQEEYLAGTLQPVFFGSALNNFGVQDLLDAFIEIAPKPQPKES